MLDHNPTSRGVPSLRRNQDQEENRGSADRDGPSRWSGVEEENKALIAAGGDSSRCQSSSSALALSSAKTRYTHK